MEHFKTLGWKLLERAKQLAPTPALLQYADVRLIQLEEQDLQFRNAVLAAHLDSRTVGYGIRVLYDGQWGFSSHHDWTENIVDTTVKEAYSLATWAARAVGKDAKKRVTFPAYPKVTAHWQSPRKIDPFTISVADKRNTMLEWDGRLRRTPGVSVATTQMSFRKENKFFFNTEGSETHQETLVSGIGYSAMASNDDDAQTRSFPNSFGGQFSQAGYELLEHFDYLGETERVGAEAVALLSADPCPQGKRDIILDGTQLGLQIHESCGHPIELDRVMGWEANYAGRSFLSPAMKDTFTYGSPIVTIYADATSPGGMGTFGFDDDGVPADHWKIVDKGIFRGFLSSRELASAVGEQKSHATMRADGWNRMPMIRMVNVSLEPGTWTLDKLLADTENGIFMETNRSWSIDQLRYNFQFGTEIGWEIKGGKKARMLKNPTYQGITPSFWASCDAICSKDEWVLWGVPNCGKGEPGQMMGTGHGAAPARFRNVQVGAGGDS